MISRVWECVLEIGNKVLLERNYSRKLSKTSRTILDTAHSDLILCEIFTFSVQDTSIFLDLLIGYGDFDQFKVDHKQTSNDHQEKG